MLGVYHNLDQALATQAMVRAGAALGALAGSLRRSGPDKVRILLNRLLGTTGDTEFQVRARAIGNRMTESKPQAAFEATLRAVLR